MSRMAWMPSLPASLSAPTACSLTSLSLSRTALQRASRAGNAFSPSCSSVSATILRTSTSRSSSALASAGPSAAMSRSETLMREAREERKYAARWRLLSLRLPSALMALPRSCWSMSYPLRQLKCLNFPAHSPSLPVWAADTFLRGLVMVLSRETLRNKGGSAWSFSDSSAFPLAATLRCTI